MSGVETELEYAPTADAPTTDRGVSQHVGRVLDEREGRWVVLTEGRRVAARRARSCLIEPRASDLVIVARTNASPAAACWILAVLDRPEDDATLAFDGDVTVRSPGKVTMAAGRGLDLLSRRQVKVAAEAVLVTAHRAEAAVDEASWVGRVFTSRIDAVKTIAGVVDRVATRVSERARRVYRTVEEAEHWRGEQLDVRASETITTQSKNTVMTAEHLMKLNGDQIHLG